MFLLFINIYLKNQMEGGEAGVGGEGVCLGSFVRGGGGLLAAMQVTECGFEEKVG